MKYLPKLGIRGKILSSVSILLVLFFILEATILNQFFLDGFKTVELENMVSDMQRVEGLINDQINNYSVKLSDWSNWDDTYNFIVNKNQAYVDSNLQNNSLANLKLSFMIFIASNGAIVQEKGIDFSQSKDLPIPEDLHNLLSQPSSITDHKTLDSESQGILRLAEGFIVFASRPILTSNATGPIRGTLLFARYIDKDFISKIADLEQSKIEIQDYNSSVLPKDFADAKNLMSTKGIQRKEPSGGLDTYYVNQENINLKSGYTIVYDYNNKPAFIVKNQLPRPFFALGSSLITVVLVIFGIVSSISLFFSFFLLDRMVLGKIKKLNLDVDEVSNPQNSKNRLDTKGGDEFSTLASNINKMLDQISLSQKDLEKFKLAIENASDHVIITDPEGIIIYANKGAERMTGYTFEEMKGNRPSLWGKQMPKEFYEKMWDTIKNKKQPFLGKLTNKNKLGLLYPVESRISPILDNNGNIEFFIGVERDISTEKKLADNLLKQNQDIEHKVELQTKEIKEEQSRLFSILESMPVGVFVLDSKGMPFYVNTEGKKLLGKSLVAVGIEELSQAYGLYRTGTNTLYPAEELPIVLAFHGKTDTVRDIEIRRDDKTIVLEVSSAPIYNSEGNIVFAISAFKDITEEKTLERSKDEFFSIASHELRTPLTAIRGNTALIKQHYQDALKNNKDLYEMIDDIHSSSERLIQIVNDFLNVSRLEQGKMEFKLENFDIVELIKSKIEEVGSLASQKNLIVAMEESTEAIPTVYADRDKLGEVILNLLGNAINHTDTGKIILKAEISGNFVKVLVSDTGRGIPANYRNLLFKKFQQAGESILTRDTTKGTGLGLYISKLLIGQMGGDIHLESSEENKGSVFSFIVPVAK